MSHHGRTFLVFSNKLFSVIWVRDHFVWSTDASKTKFRFVPDGSFRDERFVEALIEKCWNDGRISDSEYKSLEGFRLDVKSGKYRPVRESTGPSTAHSQLFHGSILRPNEFDTILHDEAFDPVVLERIRAARAATQSFTWRSPADRARNP